MRWSVLVLATLLVASEMGCTSAHAEESHRRERCQASIQVLHGEPNRPYRIIKVVDNDSDAELIREACESPNVDAIIVSLAGAERRRFSGDLLGSCIQYTAR